MKKSLFLCCFILVFTCAAKSQTEGEGYKKLLQDLSANLPEKKPASDLIEFAKKMIGIPYRYASSNPAIGFDCSGFVSYVFRNFGISTPRSSREFSVAGTPVKLSEVKIGDVLVFTGSNPRIRRAGHVGIVAAISGDTIQFIHSTSGKLHGVTITTLNTYYKSRFIKAVSML
jgi:lipoprotein Spr